MVNELKSGEALLRNIRLGCKIVYNTGVWLMNQRGGAALLGNVRWGR